MGPESVLPSLQPLSSARRATTVVGRTRPAMAAGKQIARLAPAFGQIDMGVGAVGDQRRGVGRHAVGDVGVQVQGGDDRQVGPDPFADRFEQGALGIVVHLGDHGAVQFQEHPGAVRCRLDGRQNGTGGRILGFGLDLAAGHRRGQGGKDRLPAMGLQRLQEPARFGVGAGCHPRNLVAEKQAAAPEVLEACRPLAKGVGLVRQAADDDFWGHDATPRVWEGLRGGWVLSYSFGKGQGDAAS